MTRFPWLLPVVGAVVALVVGVGAALVGIHFAAPRVETSAARTVVAPIIEPNGSTATDSASASIALPGSSSGIDPEVATDLDRVADSAAPELAAHLGLYDSTSSGDPCAGPGAGSDCPPGLLGSVGHILHTAPDLYFMPYAFLPALPAGGGGFHPYGHIPCPASGSSVPVLVVGSTPAAYTISVWPLDDPRSVTIFTGPAPTTSDISEFTDSVAAATDSNPLGDVDVCMQLAGLHANTAYVGEVRGTDYRGRAGTPMPLRFNSSGAPAHPGASITTIGQNLVMVQGLHQSDERVAIRAWVIAESAVSTCSSPHGEELTFFTTVDGASTPDQVSRANAPATYTGRTTTTFDVPEGSTLLVCARWYPDSPAPSWERENPNYESRAVLQAPDRIVPRVTFEGALGGTVDGAGFSIATVEGGRCGSLSWHRASPPSGPVTVCDPSTLARGGASSQGDRLWDRGFSGDLALTTTTVSDGERHTARVVLPLSRQACTGTCSLPSPSLYTVSLTSDTVTTADLTDYDAGGTALFQVDWVQGNSNGRSGWMSTATSDRTLANPPTPNYPQLDTQADWSVTVPTTTQPWGYGTWSLSVDRDASWDLKLTLQPGVAAPSCKPGAGPLEAQGEFTATPGETGTVGVALDGLCLGTTYHAEITLDDHHGHVATWGESDLSSWWGETSHVRVPSVRARLQYRIDASGPAPSKLERLTLLVPGTAIPSPVATEALCSRQGSFGGEGTQDVDLSSTTPLHLLLRISAAGTVNQVDDANNIVKPPECGDLTPGQLVDVTLPIDLESVLYSSGQDAPCTGQAFQLTSPYRVRIQLCALYAGPGQ